MKFFAQKLPIILVLVCSLILTGILVFLGLGTPDVRRATDQRLGKLSYVLVNEDNGTDFNGRTYHLGKNFVDLIGQDAANRWQTTTRSVAESRFRKGDYEAYIVIPQNFSAKLLSLESPSPEQADIIYRVRSGQNEIANQVIRQKIGDIITGFNQRIIRMYFSSILGNLAQAQHNVTAMVTGQQKNHDVLAEDVRKPFESLPETFDAVVGNAELLEQQNQSWQAQQEDFSARTQEVLGQSALEIDKQAEQLVAYTQLQELIGRINQSGAQQAVDAQAEDDRDAYRRLYDSLYGVGKGQLEEFFAVEEGKESGALAAFKTVAREFEAQQTARIKEFGDRIGELEEQAAQMKGLRAEIARRYFGREDRTPENVTDDDVKSAILKLADMGENAQSKVPETYFSRIDETVKAISIEEMRELVGQLYRRGLIISRQHASYQDELDIIEKYAADEGIEDGQEKKFVYRGDQELQTPDGAVSYKITVTVALDFSKEQVLRFQAQAEDGQQAALSVDFTEIAAQIRQRLTEEPVFKELEAYPEVISDGQSLKILPTRQPGDGPADTRTPLKLAVKFSFVITEQLPPDHGEYRQTRYQWTVDGEDPPQNSGMVGYYYPRKTSDGDGRPYLSLLLEQLQAVDQAAEDIVTLFGSPSQATVDGERFAELLKGSGNKAIRDIARADSMYRSYAALDADQKKALVAYSLVRSFKDQGNMLYRRADALYGALTATVGAGNGAPLQEIAASLTPPDYFVLEAGKLEGWHRRAVENSARSYASWRENPALNVGIAEYGKSDEDGSGHVIYYEEQSGKELKAEFDAFAGRAQEQMRATQEGAAQIQRLDKEFGAMKEQTQAVEKESENIFQTLDGLADDSGKKTAANAEYAENFNSVMRNATQGGGNGTVFDFLSNPLKIEGKLTGAEKSSSLPYLMTVIGTLIALACSYGLAQLRIGKKIKDTAGRPTRRSSWPNIAQASFPLAVSGGVSAIFTVASLSLKGGAGSGSWAAFTFLVLYSTVLLFAFLWRTLPKTAVYIIGGLGGIYLLLTPLLGMNIEPGSFTEWVFRASPLQNIENGYAALGAGQALGWASTAVLVAAAALGSALSFVAAASGPRKGWAGI